MSIPNKNNFICHSSEWVLHHNSKPRDQTGAGSVYFTVKFTQLSPDRAWRSVEKFTNEPLPRGNVLPIGQYLHSHCLLPLSPVARFSKLSFLVIFSRKRIIYGSSGIIVEDQQQHTQTRRHICCRLITFIHYNGIWKALPF